MSSEHNSDSCCHGQGACGSGDNSCNSEGRRDFLYMTAGAMAAVGAGSVVWPFVSQMNPAADTLAMSTTEVDVSSIEPGQAVTVMWRGKPVFIRHRTEKEIAEAKEVDVTTLRDKQADSERVQKPEWLIVIGVCTHLGCVPLGQKTGDMRGDYDGWFCPCHGSAYDTSGRIRKGPAPKNLEVPSYSFLSDTLIRIG
ncbi:MAG: ubiquinol-cytochrome c reductase iron-sulfur subunit [Pseudobdellovibrionaceae bacterium]|nr:ubiquinol-cytochrome c reductase iron-sulfur subunit [Pseudobdellovibrionaceae bacterium]